MSSKKLSDFSNLNVIKTVGVHNITFYYITFFTLSKKDDGIS